MTTLTKEREALAEHDRTRAWAQRHGPADGADAEAFGVQCALADHLRAALAHADAMERERNEQARLLGMGSEREARLLARVEEMEQERGWLRQRVEHLGALREQVSMLVPTGECVGTVEEDIARYVATLTASLTRLREENGRMKEREARLEAIIRALLAHEAEGAKYQGLAGCGCINRSRQAERLYEAGRCPHQTALAALSTPDAHTETKP
jgi:hypothetical protein